MIPGLAEGKEPRPPCEGTRVKEGGATESRRSSINNLIIARRAIRAPINYHPCSSGVNPTVSLPSSAAPTLSITPQGGRLYRGTAPSPRRPGGALPFHRANLNDPFHKRLFTLQCGHFLISGFRYRTNCFCAKENTKESSMEKSILLSSLKIVSLNVCKAYERKYLVTHYILLLPYTLILKKDIHY